MVPKDYPEILYKYRNWTNDFNKNILLKNELYLSSPKDFNDPFDCRIPDNYFLLDTPDKIDQYINGVVERHMQLLISRDLNIVDEKKRMKEKLSDLGTIQLENEKVTFDSQDERLGILCLSERWDSILMWSHYADLHKGYCVGFHENKLRESGLFGKGGPVIYSTDFPLLSPLDRNIEKKSFLETHSKAEDWAYEKEYRLMKLFYPELPHESDRIIKIPDDFFAEVIIGLATPNSAKLEIISICKQKNIKCYVTNKIPFEFKISRHLL